MTDNNVGFIFTFSADTTQKIINGDMPLSAGGSRADRGRLSELCRPLSIESGMIDFNEYKANSRQTMEGIGKANEQLISVTKENKEILNAITAANSSLDLIESKLIGLEETAWLNYAATHRLYQMGFDGFNRMLMGIGLISSEIEKLNKRLDDKEQGDKFQKMLQCAQDLKSIAGFMETKGFSATAAFFDVVKTINEVFSYLSRLFSDVKREIGSDSANLRSIISLFMPYCYVVFRYSILYYYETGALPPNYSDWIKIAERISKDARFRNRFEYYLRVNADMSLRNAIALEKRIFHNYRSTVADMGVYCKYALTHTKEEYESIESQLREMILQKKYVLRDGHMMITLP